MSWRDWFRKKGTSSPETPPTAEPPGDGGDVTEHLELLLRGHGVATERHGPTIVVPGTPYRAEAEIVKDRVHAQAHSIPAALDPATGVTGGYVLWRRVIH